MVRIPIGTLVEVKSGEFEGQQGKVEKRKPKTKFRGGASRTCGHLCMLEGLGQAGWINSNFLKEVALESEPTATAAASASTSAVRGKGRKRQHDSGACSGGGKTTLGVVEFKADKMGSALHSRSFA